MMKIYNIEVVKNHLHSYTNTQKIEAVKLSSFVSIITRSETGYVCFIHYLK